MGPWRRGRPAGGNSGARRRTLQPLGADDSVAPHPVWTTSMAQMWAAGACRAGSVGEMLSMTDDQRNLDLLCVNTIRTLCIDAVQKAESGHPGAAMGMAPVAYVLFDRFLRYSPTDPHWPNRDRFVLSMGHASTLLYSLLHLTGFDVSLDDIKQFRQLHARCAGHPEFGLVPGVETTTGPLGQGAGTSVGMAVAGKWLARHFNRPGHELFDYRVVALCGDGDMMEGVTAEAASLAGHLALDNLIWVYDSNGITIDGSTSQTFTEDVGDRFKAYGWHVEQVGDANDLAAVAETLQRAADEEARPSLIVVKSHIGYGSPKKQDTAGVHGSPLGADEVRANQGTLRLGPRSALPRAGGGVGPSARRGGRTRPAGGGRMEVAV